MRLASSDALANLPDRARWIPARGSQAARDEGIKHIVMGTRGLGSIQGLLLGSVAMKVVHLAEVPITLLK